MEKILAKITFLHDARPYTGFDERENITVAFPNGTLPNVGDIVSIDGIKRPEGAFVVHHRVWALSKTDLIDVTLTLSLESRK